MFSPLRSLVRFRMFGLLLVGCVMFSFAGGALQADPATEGLAGDSTSPIVFDGWRRTANGWEQLPLEHARPSINDWIAHQKEEEANNPLAQPLQYLGRFHPVRIAAAEVAVACLIALFASSRRDGNGQSPEQTEVNVVG